jgi:hypothetical protein
MKKEPLLIYVKAPWNQRMPVMNCMMPCLRGFDPQIGICELLVRVIAGHPPLFGAN